MASTRHTKRGQGRVEDVLSVIAAFTSASFSSTFFVLFSSPGACCFVCLSSCDVLVSCFSRLLPHSCPLFLPVIGVEISLKFGQHMKKTGKEKLEDSEEELKKIGWRRTLSTMKTYTQSLLACVPCVCTTDALRASVCLSFFVPVYPQRVGGSSDLCRKRTRRWRL